MSQADIIVVTVPGGGSNTNMIDAAAIAEMQETAHFSECGAGRCGGRGRTDTAALARAPDRGRGPGRLRARTAGAARVARSRERRAIAASGDRRARGA